jgi:redox-sensitive bicupin YhaK (pirin superfamily)
MADDAVLDVKPLGFPWPAQDPFLFCAYHDDAYPEGNDVMGPATSLAGRNLGQDFTVKDGFRMYHGETVPGFPSHPHRGFETVTIVRRGVIDHSDSLGATARFGEGDVQWLTAGRGIVHAEMFPLRRRDAPNPLELFQIWLNLPASSKMAEPHFRMLWSEEVPRKTFEDGEGGQTIVTVVAGKLGDVPAPPPPPDSWAARAESDVAIFTIAMTPGTAWTLPKASNPRARRTLYFFKGSRADIGGRGVHPPAMIELLGDRDVAIANGPQAAELLLLQGVAIGEPVAQAGPFVMNTDAEVQQAFADFRRTQFGRWPFDRRDPVHPREQGRFARHADGRVEDR